MNLVRTLHLGEESGLDCAGGGIISWARLVILMRPVGQCQCSAQGSLLAYGRGPHCSRDDELSPLCRLFLVLSCLRTIPVEIVQWNILHVIVHM